MNLGSDRPVLEHASDPMTTTISFSRLGVREQGCLFRYGLFMDRGLPVMVFVSIGPFHGPYHLHRS